MLKKRIEASNPNSELSLFVDVSPSSFSEFARTHQVHVKQRYGSLHHITIPVENIQALDRLEGLISLEYYWAKGQAMNDTMRVNNRVDSVLSGASPLPSGYTGKGVIVGLVDAGMDVNHPDFKDGAGNSRILELWDQLAATKWDSTDINNGSCTHQGQLSYFGHGSQVAGIAAGNGLAVGRYKGVAPDADIIAVNSDFNATNWLSTVVDGFDFIYRHADTIGKPVVINASIGTYVGSHDGLDIPAMMIDTMVRAKKGRALVAAAGNAGHIPFHIGYNITSDTNFTWFTYNASTSMVFWQVWADSLDFVNAHFAFGADRTSPFQYRGRTGFDQINNRLNQTITDSIMAGANVLAYVQTYAEYVRGRYRLQVMMNNPDSSSYYFRFLTTGSGKLDIWCPFWQGTSQTVTAGLPGIGTFPDIQWYKRADTLQTMVSSFQCLESALTVANYTNTDVYWDFDTVLQVTTETRGAIGSSSSWGPSRTGLQKPDVSASGNNTMSTCDTFIVNLALGASQEHNIGIGGMHKKNGGTSMASPVVAGTAALLLERCPSMGWKELHDAVVNHTYADTHTGTVPNNRWGSGKLDAMTTVVSTLRKYTLTPLTALVCQGDSVSISGPGNFSSYQWNVAPTGSSFYSDSTGVYYSTASDTSGCLQYSDTATTTLVPPAPKLTISQSNDTLSIPQGYAPYQWYMNGGALSGETNNFHHATATGNYHVTYTDSNGCIGISDTVSFTSSVWKWGKNLVRIVPNPASDNCKIVLGPTFNGEKFALQLFSAGGRLCKRTVATVNGGSLAFTVSDLQTGLYFVNIEGAGFHYTCKLSVLE